MDLSFLGGELWIIPLATTIGCAIASYWTVKKKKSGSMKYNKDRPADYNLPDLPYTKLGEFWFAVGLFAATIIILIVMYKAR